MACYMLAFKTAGPYDTVMKSRQKNKKRAKEVLAAAMSASFNLLGLII